MRKRKNFIFIIASTVLICVLSICSINYFFLSKNKLTGTFVNQYINISKQENINVNGIVRNYNIYIPIEYNKTTSMPVVMVFHGENSSPEEIEQITGFSRKAEKENFIVVYPEAIDESNTGENRTWNAYNCCGYANKTGIDDVDFIKSLVNKLGKDLNIDKSKIYTTGFSNGAMFVNRIVQDLPSVFAAIAPVAGNIGGKATSDSEPISLVSSKPTFVLMIHGQQDKDVPYDGGASQGNYPNRVDLSAQDSIDFWTNNSGCNTEKVESNPSTNVMLDIYSGCNSNTVIQLYTIKDQGHAWPGDTSWERLLTKTTDKPSSELNATDVIWNFFKDKTLVR